MENIKAGILGTGFYVPEKILTNADLEKMVDTSDEWITTRTGIKERHIIDDKHTTSDLAMFASLEALKNAGVAQLAEQRNHNPFVGGSSPSSGIFFINVPTIIKKCRGFGIPTIWKGPKGNRMVSF